MSTYSEIEQLASELRGKGFSTDNVRDLERLLHRRLNKHERRALVIASDSRSLPSGTKRQSALRLENIRECGQFTFTGGIRYRTVGEGSDKHREPLPRTGNAKGVAKSKPRHRAPQLDQQTVKRASQARFSQSERTKVLDPKRMHEFADGSYRTNDRLTVLQYHDMQSPIQRAKADDWDKKK